MEKSQILDAIKHVRTSKQRKFKQSFDLVVVLKDIDMKNQDHKLDFFFQLPKSKGKKVKVCGLVGGELFEEAKKHFDMAIHVDDFAKYADKKEAKKLAEEYDLFVAQATIMPKVATAFGKVFGPKGKMPNPKAGCVVPPNASLGPLYERLQKTVRVVTKNAPMVQITVGKEEMSDDDVAENVSTAYNQVMTHLPQEINNIKHTLLKLTMGAPTIIGESKKEEGQ